MEPRPPFPEPGFQAKYMLTYSLEGYVILRYNYWLPWQYIHKKNCYAPSAAVNIFFIGSIHAYIHLVLQ